MNRRLLVVFVCALLTAACIGYLVYRALGVRASPTPAIPMADIVLASRDLEVGALVSAPDLRMAKWPGTVPKGALVKMDLALDRGVVSPIYEGEPVLVTRLAAGGSGAGLAALIPFGMRACAVKVDEVVGVSGFVTPGMRVDVLMAGIPPGESAAGGPRVKTLMQNIQVLSAGANLQKDNEGKPQQAQVVNLLVTPEQAETLSLASNQTHIQLVLRNPGDTHLTSPPGAAMSGLFGVSARVATVEKTKPGGEAIVKRPQLSSSALPSPPAAKPIPAVVRLVEVLNGATRTEARFELPKDPQ